MIVGTGKPERCSVGQQAGNSDEFILQSWIQKPQTQPEFLCYSLETKFSLLREL